ncbi:MAG: hypothetical protein J6F31_01465 [Oscillospiraceae bacterium]|nr:hypothetical protein [Oscillospiraceae bacterium]
MAVDDVSDLKEKREKQDEKDGLVRIAVILFIAALAAIAVFTRHSWYPAVYSAFHKGETLPEESVAEESGKQGEFPIKIDGGMGYQLLSMDNALALLDDSKLHIYNLDGKLMNESMHTYANPILRVSPSKALVYDVGGTMFRLESRYKTVYEKEADDVIYLAEVSDRDLVGVVTRSDKYLSTLRIYDEKGENIFSYYSYDGRITNIAFNKDSSGAVISVLTAQGGELLSTLVRFDFLKPDPIWVADPVPALPMDLKINSNDTISLTGDDKYILFDSNGVVLERSDYDNAVKDYASSGDLTAVITENSALRKTALIEFHGAGDPVVTILENGADDVYIYGDQVLVLSGDKIRIFSPGGENMYDAVLEDQFENVCKNGNYIFLLGYDNINRIQVRV